MSGPSLNQIDDHSQRLLVPLALGVIFGAFCAFSAYLIFNNMLLSLLICPISGVFGFAFCMMIISFDANKKCNYVYDSKN